MSIKESEITDFILGKSIKDEVQKNHVSAEADRLVSGTGSKFLSLLGTINSHAGPGVKYSIKIVTGIPGVIILAKLSIAPIWRGTRGTRLASPTPFCKKVTGLCGSVMMPLTTAPRGTGNLCS